MTPKPEKPRALEGLKVIDFTQMFAGPGTGMYLADQGADVIKIEPPNGGRDRASDGGGDADSFLLLNRGKRSLVLDIRAPEGKQIVEKLVKRSDVMLVAFPPGQSEKLGLGYEHMAALNPRIVYGNITGWGYNGPMAMRTGYDRLQQAHTGMMHRNQAPDGTPMVLPFFVADQGIPMLLSYGIMLALWNREKTGKGQKVDVSQLDLQIAIQSLRLVFREDDHAAAHGDFPAHTYKTSDNRHLTLVPILDSEWSRLWQTLGLDPEPDEILKRKKLAQTFAQRPVAEWIELLESADLPAAAVRTPEEFVQHPQAWANNMLVERDHAQHGKVKMMATPVRLSDTPGQPGWPPPKFGEHTSDVLTELGYTPEQVETLTRAGVVK
jgi:crotonobetainyl-CoA:carnitine CoA-transferase CaiB-like acyl-CoA transferase